jgi:acetyl-CoA decarbonylase/synthase complex subunit delta
MRIELLKESYSGKICESIVGKDLGIGGEDTLPFYTFEGNIPNEPRIAMEVYDIPPKDWPETCLAPFKEVVSSPVAWAKKCVEYGADMICIQLIGTDPTAENKSAEEAAELCRDIVNAVDLPVIVWGSGKIEKDAEVLKKVAEACEGKNIILGPVQENNYKTIGATAIGYKHKVAASAPMDVNLSKQLNILLGNLGVANDQILMDPTAGCLGYGIEYVYSIIERGKLAALVQNDAKLQMPFIINLGKEVWKVKEVKLKDTYDTTLGYIGDCRQRGILWEAISAMGILIAGANVIIMRHPEAVKLVKSVMNKLFGKEEKRKVEKVVEEKVVPEEKKPTIEMKVKEPEPKEEELPKAKVKEEPKIEEIVSQDIDYTLSKINECLERLDRYLDTMKPVTVKIIIGDEEAVTVDDGKVEEEIKLIKEEVSKITQEIKNLEEG